jgi:hypothetical protein
LFGALSDEAKGTQLNDAGINLIGRYREPTTVLQTLVVSYERSSTSLEERLKLLPEVGVSRLVDHHGRNGSEYCIPRYSDIQAVYRPGEVITRLERDNDIVSVPSTL